MGYLRYFVIFQLPRNLYFRFRPLDFMMYANKYLITWYLAFQYKATCYTFTMLRG